LGTLDRHGTLDQGSLFGSPIDSDAESFPDAIIRFDDTTGEWTTSTATVLHTIPFIIDGGGTTITTGIKGTLHIPFAATILEWTITSDQVGSINVDINKSSFSGYPTTSSITGSEHLILSSAQKNQSSTLSGWTVDITADDILEFEVDSVSTVEKVTINLYVTEALTYT
jgi:hypothetical protein